ncbi:TonB-dependent receptor domain-containing protein [Balneatrix alpica]|uniref:TonB-dependent receptor domain-containing protein n=1 Tax=Balneatrix alpica TaxID=75684 RepID=A0ABV5Z884_9GAMM|nr:TonB-dependent receptor [Balneatrix alpica]
MTQTVQPKTPLTLVAVAVAAAISPAWAQAQTLVNNEKIVVVGKVKAASETVVDQQALEKKQAATLHDVFSGEPSVAVGGGSSVAQKIYVRGLEDTMLNVTIDGATQAGYIYHHQGRLSVEPELLKQVEVEAGAGAATSGPGALAGAIRFETKDPNDLLKDGQNFGATLKTGGSTNADAVKGSATLYGRLNDNWSLMGTWSGADYGNQKDGKGQVQQYTGSEQQAQFAKVVGEFDSQRLALSYDRRQDEDYRLHRPHWVPSSKNTPLQQETLRETVSVNYGLNPVDNPLLALKVNVYQTEASLEHINGPYGTYKGSLKSNGLDLRNTSELGKHAVTYGVDYREDKGRLAGSGNVDREEGSVKGIYLQDNFQATERLLLSFGGRYDSYKLDEPRAKQSFSESGFSPNAGLVFEVNDNLSFNANWAKALRGTQVKELYVLDYYKNAADRREEKARNYELGVDYHQGGFQASAKVFNTKIDGGVGQVSKAVLGNLGTLENKGFNARVGYSWDSFSTGLSFSRARPELNGQPLSDESLAIGTAIGDTWVADFNYRASDSLEFGWQGRFVERLTNVASGFQPKAGYVVHDVNARWQPWQQHDFSLNLAVKNLFDKHYYDHATYANTGAVAQGLPEAGRDIRLTATLVF